jgi:PST family polysaccharide transporter
MASDLSVLPTQSVIGPAMQPVMAAFARIADDRDRLAKAYLRASSYTMMTAAPAGIGIALTADLIVHLLLGPNWAASAFSLRWLALATMLSAFYQPLYSAALALNRPIVIFRLSLLEIACKVLFVALGYWAWSMTGVLAARGAVSVIMFFTVLVVGRRLIGAPATAQLASLWRAAAASAVMATLVLALRHQLAGRDLAPVLELGLTAAVGATAYVAALYALGFRPVLRPGGKLLVQL